MSRWLSYTRRDGERRPDSAACLSHLSMRGRRLAVASIIYGAAAGLPEGSAAFSKSVRRQRDDAHQVVRERVPKQLRPLPIRRLGVRLATSGGPSPDVP